MSKKFFAVVCLISMVAIMACSKKTENKEVIVVDEDATPIMVVDSTEVKTIDATPVVPVMDATPVVNPQEVDMSMLPVNPAEPSMGVEPAMISNAKIIN